ncbi:MAG: hypothetical protein ACW98Y_17270 [Candidatus Thorarchaeota archaeon]|jgi:hypothetical protein
MKKEEKEVASQIWAIRDSIQELEDIKDEIISYLREKLELNESDEHIWINDTKGVYFNIVAAWQMLNSCTRQKPEDQAEKANNSLNFLKIAKSHLGQSASELRALKEEAASDLEKKWKKTFKKCHSSIAKQLERYLGSESREPPKEIIGKKDDKAYTLACAICGQVAVVIIQRTTQFVYSGIIVETVLESALAKDAFKFLNTKDLKSLHSHLKKDIQLEDGMDAYCPECDTIYCATHYKTEEEWDEGFYDCTYGTCPEGHRRIIHD